MLMGGHSTLHRARCKPNVDFATDSVSGPVYSINIHADCSFKALESLGVSAPRGTSLFS